MSATALLDVMAIQSVSNHRQDGVGAAPHPAHQRREKVNAVKAIDRVIQEEGLYV